MACRNPIRSERHNSQSPRTRAAPRPMARVTVSMVCRGTPTPTRWAASVRTMPAPVAGATQDRTVPGAPRFSTQLHPSPVMRDSAPRTPPEISPAVSRGRTRERQGMPGPIHPQPM